MAKKKTDGGKPEFMVRLVAQLVDKHGNVVVETDKMSGEVPAPEDFASSRTEAEYMGFFDQYEDEMVHLRDSTMKDFSDKVMDEVKKKATTPPEGRK